MPSATFERLPNEKKERLIQAAIEEFSRVPYHDASINMIIEKAGIPRGSFYQYFKDKEDLYQYLLQSYKEKMKQLIDKNIELYHGDLYHAFLHIFKDVIDVLNKDTSTFFENVFKCLTATHEKFIIPQFSEKPSEEFNTLKKSIDSEYLKIEDGWDVGDMFHLLMQLTIPDITRFILSKITLEEAYQQYKQKLQMICKGIYREEYPYDKNA